MQIGRIQACTRVLGKDQGYVPLPVRDIIEDGVKMMESAWFPTLEELHALLDGAPVILGVVGTVHPPVRLEVGISPKDRGDDG